MSYQPQDIDLAAIAAALSEAHVPYVTVGSAALKLHGVDLEVLDLDLLVASSRAPDQDRIAHALRALGTPPQLINHARQELSERPWRTQVPTPDGVVLDLRDGERSGAGREPIGDSFDWLCAQTHVAPGAGLATLSLEGLRAQLSGYSWDLLEIQQVGEDHDPNPASTRALAQESRRIDGRLVLIDSLIALEPELNRAMSAAELHQAPEQQPSMKAPADDFELGF